MKVVVLDHAPRVGERAPKLGLPEAVSGTLFDIPRQSRRSYLVFFGHDSRCPQCNAYRDSLAERLPSYQGWDGTVLSVVAGDRVEASLAKSGLALFTLADAGGAAHQRFGLPTACVGLALVDRFGVVARIEAAPDADELPDARAIEADIQYLGINCDECVVPESQWRPEQGKES